MHKYEHWEESDPLEQLSCNNRTALLGLLSQVQFIHCLIGNCPKEVLSQVPPLKAQGTVLNMFMTS